VNRARLRRDDPVPLCDGGPAFHRLDQDRIGVEGGLLRLALHAKLPDQAFTDPRQPLELLVDGPQLSRFLRLARSTHQDLEVATGDGQR
jgi:hypothetical protein